MTRRIDTTIMALALVLLASAGAAQEQGYGLETFDRFSGNLRLVTRQGPPRDLQVEVNHWSIRGGQRVDRLPGTGFRLVQLVAGSLTTVIDGQRAERREGEFWTVPAGGSMVLETGDDTAVLQVMTVR
jgi:quercetin dioxygenase-like cupin family protein